MDLPMISSPTRLRTLSMRPASTRRIFSTVFCGIRGSRVAGWALAGADALLSDSDIDDSDVDESSIDDSDVDDSDVDDLDSDDSSIDDPGIADCGAAACASTAAAKFETTASAVPAFDSAGMCLAVALTFPCWGFGAAVAI